MLHSPISNRLLLTWLLLTLVLVPSARAEYFAVFADGTGPYPNIAAAVAAADEGDIVNLYPGVYSGPGNRDVLVTNDIIIQANDPLWTVTIDCGGSATDPHRAFIVQNSGVQIKYLKIVGGYQEQGGAILSTGSYLELERCEFRSNHATEAGGAVAVDGGWFISERSIYARNRCDEEGGAIYAQDGAQISLGQNTMVSNGASHGGHVYLTENADLTVDRSLLVFGTGGAAVEDYYSPNITITCTDVYANQGGDWVLTLAGQMSAGDNKNVDPLMIDPLGPEPDYFFVLGSPAWMGGSQCNHLGALTGDLHDGPPRYTVLPDGMGMFPTIQEAMAEIAEGGIIELESEPYFLDLSAGPMDPLGRGMVVRTRPSETGERATLGNASTDWWLVMENDEDETTVFEDLIFSGQGSGGGGFKIRGSVGAQFVNCEIRNQFGRNTHGIVDIENDTGEQATVSFTDCVFIENAAGSCIEADHWDVDLVNCDFLDNHGQAGESALDLRQSQGTIRSCRFENNLSSGRGTLYIEGSVGQEIRIIGGHFIDNTAGLSGGNISLHGDIDLSMDSVIMTGAQADRFGACIYTDTTGDGSRVTLADCIFNAPEGGTPLDSGGAIKLEYRDVTMTSCVFRNWTVEGDGGAVYLLGGEAYLLECTFENNGAEGNGGGLYLANMNPIVDSCMFRDNTAGTLGGGLYLFESPAQVTGCFFEGNTAISGGGMYNREVTGNSPLQLDNLVFARNTAAETGAGLTVLGSAGNVQMNGCTVVNNNILDPEALGGQLFVGVNRSLLMEYTLIASSETEAIAGYGPVTTQCCDVWGNTGGDWTGLLAGQLTYEGNLSVNPMFCDPQAGVYTLADDSVCLPDNNICVAQIGAFGAGNCTGLVGVPDLAQAVVSLAPAYPNPFNPCTTLEFSLPEARKVNLAVYNLRGQRVRTLCRRENRAAGEHAVTWRGDDDQGHPLAGGVYLVRLEAGDVSSVQRVALVK